MTRVMLFPMKVQTASLAGFGIERLIRASSTFICARRAILAAAALLGLLTLGGCGGGGGGSPGTPDSGMPTAFTYPTSLSTATSTDNVEGFMSPYAFNPSTTNPPTPSLVSVLPTVSGTSPSAGTIAITVAAIQLPPPSTSIEPAFVVTFNPADSSSTVLTNSPLDVLPTLVGVSGPCVGCLKTVTVQATSTTTPAPVTFTYLDPTSVSFPLTYSALGMWTKPTTTGTGGAPDANWPEVGGAFSAGVMTRGIDLPTTGSASYSGYFIGRYATSIVPQTGIAAGTYVVGANASATADFGANLGAGAVSFSTSNTQIAPESSSGLGTPIPFSGLNLSSVSPMQITRTLTSNAFAGTAVTSNSALSGPIQGGFYGQPATTAPFAPPEAGGSLSVNGANQNMVGSFALKKQ